MLCGIVDCSLLEAVRWYIIVLTSRLFYLWCIIGDHTPYYYFYKSLQWRSVNSSLSIKDISLACVLIKEQMIWQYHHSEMNFIQTDAKDRLEESNVLWSQVSRCGIFRSLFCFLPFFFQFLRVNRSKGKTDTTTP